MRTIERLNSFGVNPKDAHRYHKQIERYNLNALKNFSVTMVPLVLVVALISLPFKLNTQSIISLGILAIVSVFTALLASRMLRSKDVDRFTIFTFITIYTIICYMVTMYSGVLVNRNNIAILFLLLLITNQVIYIMPLSWSIILSSLSSVAVAISSVLCKDSEFWMQDCRNICIALTASIFLSFISTREKAQLVVANSKLAKEYDALSEASELDKMTGLYNKVVSQEKLAEFARACADNKCSVFAAIIDVDFFKKYNDHYGHLMGDEVLRMVGAMMNSIAKEYDIVAGRVGGEEFLLCGAVGSNLQATRICDKLRIEISSKRIEHVKSDAAPFLTISVGVMFESIGGELTSDEIYEMADKALYEAKRAGRNCVKTYI